MTRCKPIVAPAVCLACGYVERYWPGTWDLETNAGSSITSGSYFVGKPEFSACRGCDAPQARMLSRAEIATFRMGGPAALFSVLGISPKRGAYGEAHWPDQPPGSDRPDRGYVIVEPS